MAQTTSVDSDDKSEVDASASWENNATALWEVECEISQKELDKFKWEEISDE